MVMELYGPGKPARVLLVEDDARAGDGARTRCCGRSGTAAWWSAIHSTSTTRSRNWPTTGRRACCWTCTSEPALEALEQLSTSSPMTPIVVVADGEDEDMGVAAVRAGAQDYLVRSELSAPRLARAVSYAVERKRTEAALALQALHDPLTALPNRALFLDRLRGALDRSRRTGAPVVVLFLDVDGFKQINDTLGHGAGDRLLNELADRFRAMLRPMDTVARFGGDEFTFLFEGLESEEEAALVAQRVTQSAGLPLILGGRAADGRRSASASTSSPTPRRRSTTSSARPTPPCTAPRSRAGTASRSSTTSWPGCRGRARTWSGSCARRSSASELRDPLPAARLVRRRDRPGGVRGARALGAPRAGADGARRVHVDRRGDRADRPHRRVGAPARPWTRSSAGASRVRG